METLDNEQLNRIETEVEKQRKELSSDRMDISFGEIINLYKNKEIIIRPEYQRLFRWTAEQKTAFIESIILSIPIPPIFVAEDKNGIWELIDGLQRISTFISFFGDLEKSVSEMPIAKLDEVLEDEEDIDIETVITIGNKWCLTDPKLIKSLDNFNIDTLPNNLKINLKRSVCRVEILRGESSTTMKYELFKRLNSGGSKLTPQEIRNAIFRGVNPMLNEILIELSQESKFKRLTNLSRAKLSELYDQELILRFFAFLNNSNNINDNTENFLNKFMEDTVNDKKFNFTYYKNLFLETLELVDTIDDDKIFRNPRNLFVPAYFEGILIGVAQNIEIYKTNPNLLVSKIMELKSSTEFKKYSGSASNSKSRIKSRLTEAIKIFTTNDSVLAAN
jgi:Protein of unknown function DUF262